VSAKKLAQGFPQGSKSSQVSDAANPFRKSIQALAETFYTPQSTRRV